MLALWIVLAVVVAALVVGLVVAVPRRRRGRVTPSAGASTTTTIERPPPRPASPTSPPTPVETPPEAPAVEPEPEPEAETAPPELRERLGKTRGLFSGYVRSLRSRASVDDEAWDELEEALLRADVGIATTTALLEDLRSRVRNGELRGADAVVAALREDLRRSLDTTDGTGLSLEGDGTIVWLFVGVNGVGKTTTIGKVARREKAAGRSVLLAAGDTFRAAAAEQLDQWAQRAGVDIVRGAEGGDPSAVVFDA